MSIEPNSSSAVEQLAITYSNLPANQTLLSRPKQHFEIPNSSLGLLRRLPNELFRNVCDHLDFQSLARFSQASSGIKKLVDEQPVYRAVTQHGKSVLKDLVEHRLIKRHSSAWIEKTLHTRNCEECGVFGSHVFLPTFKRFCYHCISKSPMCKLAVPSTAERCFALTHRQRWSEISATHLYDLPYTRTFRSVVSVEEALQLAIKIHGSMEGIIEASKKPPFQNGWFETFMMTKCAPSYLYSVSLEDLLSPGFTSIDSLSVKLSSRMPWVDRVTRQVEIGVRCRGCVEMASLGRRGLLTPAVEASVLPPGVTSKEGFRMIGIREWAREELIEHVRTCHGIRKLEEDCEDYEE